MAHGFGQVPGQFGNLRRAIGRLGRRLVSDVMANAPAGCVWLTVQGHPNIVAVAVLREMAAVVLTGGRSPDPETVGKSEQERIPILMWPGSALELAGRLYTAGVGGGPAA